MFYNPITKNNVITLLNPIFPTIFTLNLRFWYFSVDLQPIYINMRQFYFTKVSKLTPVAFRYLSLRHQRHLVSIYAHGRFRIIFVNVVYRWRCLHSGTSWSSNGTVYYTNYLSWQSKLSTFNRISRTLILNLTILAFYWENGQEFHK